MVRTGCDIEASPAATAGRYGTGRIGVTPDRYGRPRLLLVRAVTSSQPGPGLPCPCRIPRRAATEVPCLRPAPGSIERSSSPIPPSTGPPARPSSPGCPTRRPDSNRSTTDTAPWSACRVHPRSTPSPGSTRRRWRLVTTTATSSSRSPSPATGRLSPATAPSTSHLPRSTGSPAHSSTSAFGPSGSRPRRVGARPSTSSMPRSPTGSSAACCRPTWASDRVGPRSAPLTPWPAAPRSRPAELRARRRRLAPIRWSEVRSSAAACSTIHDDDLSPSIARWLDDGSLARWLFARYPEPRQVFRDVCELLEPSVAGAFLATHGIGCDPAP